MKADGRTCTNLQWIVCCCEWSCLVRLLCFFISLTTHLISSTKKALSSCRVILFVLRFFFLFMFFIYFWFGYYWLRCQWNYCCSLFFSEYLMRAHAIARLALSIRANSSLRVAALFWLTVMQVAAWANPGRYQYQYNLCESLLPLRSFHFLFVLVFVLKARAARKSWPGACATP